MALTITMVAESYSSGTFTAQPDNSNLPTGSFTIDYRILADTIYPDAGTVMMKLAAMGASIVPGKAFTGDYIGGYDVDQQVKTDYCVAKLAIRADRDGNHRRWNATATYEPKPDTMPVEISFQASHYEETVTENVKYHEPILNKAGDPLAQAIMEAKGRLRIEITRRYPIDKWDPSVIASAIYHKSNSAIRFPYQGINYTYAKNQLYCTDIRSPILWEPSPHWKVTAMLEVDEEGFYDKDKGKVYWVRHPLNVGYRYLDSNKKPTPFSAGKGVIHGGQGALATDGTKLPDGQTPNFLSVETIPEFDFNSLKLFPGQ